MIGVVLLLPVVGYVGSYLALSRRGYAAAERYGIQGFYYLPPQDSPGWRAQQQACWLVFWPLNQIDRLAGTGQPVAFEPTWGLLR